MKKGWTLPDCGECGKPQDCPEKREEVKMDAEERLIKLFKVGCPQCQQKDSFLLDSTDQVRRMVQPDPEDRESIQFEDSEYIDTVSDDFIICPNCFWGEALEK